MAWIDASIDHQTRQSLLIRRNTSTGELAFYRCWSPAPVSLATLVRVAGIRWCVEESFQAAKGQVGLDQYQVRGWTPWHRFITLAMLALAFLSVLASRAAPDQAAEPHHYARDGGPIALTTPEIRHLFAVLLHSSIASPAHLLRWSNWWHQHQGRARQAHYRRRLDTGTG